MTNGELEELKEEIENLCETASNKYSSIYFLYGFDDFTRKYFIGCKIIDIVTLKFVNKIADKMGVKVIEYGNLYKTTSLIKIRDILKDIIKG